MTESQTSRVTFFGIHTEPGLSNQRTQN